MDEWYKGEGMLVKSSQVLAKFLILFSIANTSWASVFTPLSTTNGVRQDYNDNSNIVAVAVNIFKVVSGRLGAQDQETHTMTVIHAMQNLDNGEITEWHNPEKDTAGRVQVVMTYPVFGGYCRKFFTEVRIKNNIREFNETGCKTMDSPYWNFSR
jgi:surface antigen